MNRNFFSNMKRNFKSYKAGLRRNNWSLLSISQFLVGKMSAFPSDVHQTFILFLSGAILMRRIKQQMSRLMTKPTKWYVRPAKTLISLGTHPVWSESSLSAWRNLGSLATHWAPSEDSDQIGRMPRLIWVFAGRTVILLVLSWGGSNILHLSINFCKQYIFDCLFPIYPLFAFWFAGLRIAMLACNFLILLGTAIRCITLEPVAATWYAMIIIILAATRQNQQNDCAPSEDSDQPGHPPSLIRVFAVRMKKPWVLSCPLNAQRRLWSDWADAQADLSLCWAHSHFVAFVVSRLMYCLKASNYFWLLNCIIFTLVTDFP